jgi:glycine cleavage system H protein
VSNVPANLSYTNEHEWVLISNGADTYKIGITDYAQEALGDIVYIQLPKIGDLVSSGAICGEIESTKSVSEIYSPLTGKIVAINGELDTKPEIVNSDPYGQGWIAEIQIEGALPTLLTAEQYSQITA